MMALLYLAVFMPLRRTESGRFIGELFLDRGYIPYVTTLITCWGIAILALKYIAVKKQISYADLELELIPLETGLQITPANVDQFLEHLNQLEEPQRQSILGRRIQGALEHFKSRNSVPEVQEYLSTQAQIDASQVDSGYTLLRAFIWAVPILGFIGTVLGIGAAVGGLNATLGEDPGGESLMAGMQTVTSGLSVAFDTTLVALCMALVILFPTESLRKSEYAMLDRIETFANESLLRRMSDDDRQRAYENMPEVVRDALESAFHEHQRWLAQWQLQVSELGDVVGSHFEKAVYKAIEEMAQADASREIRVREFEQLVDDLFDRVGDVVEREPSHDGAGAASNEIRDAARDFQNILSENVRQYGEFLEMHRRLLEESAPDAPASAGDQTTVRPIDNRD